MKQKLRTDQKTNHKFMVFNASGQRPMFLTQHFDFYLPYIDSVMRERFKGLLSFEGSILRLFISTCGSSSVVYSKREYEKYRINPVRRTNN